MTCTKDDKKPEKNLLGNFTLVLISYFFFYFNYLTPPPTSRPSSQVMNCKNAYTEEKMFYFLSDPRLD